MSNPRTADEIFEDYYANGRQVTLTEEEVKAELYKEFNPARVDCIWNDDYTIVTIKELKWWDDASYIAYQSRC